MDQFLLWFGRISIMSERNNIQKRSRYSDEQTRNLLFDMNTPEMEDILFGSDDESGSDSRQSPDCGSSPKRTDSDNQQQMSKVRGL